MRIFFSKRALEAQPACRSIVPWCAFFATLFVAIPALAVRPFVTDDGEVAGDEHVEMETWAQVGKKSFEHNLMFGVGMNSWLELGFGFVHGTEGGAYGIQGPIFHVKASLRELPENGWTLAIAGGGAAPIGHGSYEPDGGTGFLYGAFTHAFNDRSVLIHANLGVAFEGQASRTLWSPTVAYGVQFHIASLLHGVVEAFYSDPMDPGFEFGGQVGLRVVVSDYVQIDATAGSELTMNGDLHPWGTLGLRLVSKGPKTSAAHRPGSETRNSLNVDPLEQDKPL